VKYALYPGCVAEDSCKELGLAIELVTRKLGLEMTTIENATCCGSGYLTAYDGELSNFLNGRTLALAEKAGADTLVTVCSLCQLSLMKVDKELKRDPAALKRTNERLAEVKLHYSGKLKIKHLLQALLEDYGIEKIAAKVTRPLNLKVAPFYSCQLLRPSDVLHFDDPEDPKSLDNLIKALGGTSVEFPGKTKCCGFHILVVDPEMAIKMSGSILEEVKKRGADCMVVPCPCCHLVFDMYQPRIEKSLGKKLRLPIVHLPQLIGLALGMTPKELGMGRHVADATKLLPKAKASTGS
jgi:succinate dehydrogenase / fumarate reductase cytochrome b subunit